MTKVEYKKYQQRFENFMRDNVLNNISLVSDKDGNYKGYFTWNLCPVCGNNLGHTGYNCNGYSDKYGIMEFDNVCEDCIYYAEYGKLDDMTMLEMEE